MSDNLNAQSKRRTSTVMMVQLALLSAIMVVLAVTPLGMINLGFINATTLHIPVIVGAILLGPKAGAFLGGVFGLISLITNTVRPNLSSFAFSPFYSVGENSGNFWSLVICFVPRILVGITAAYLFIWISKIDKSKIIACMVSGLVASLVNTVFVMGGIYIFFGEQWQAVKNVVFEGFFSFIAMMVGTAGIPEAIVAMILSTLIARPLMNILKKVN